jgi:hypothetical protein
VYNHSDENRSSAFLATNNFSENIQVKIYPRWYKQVSVEWAIPADWGNCEFNVYFSQVEDGDFQKLTSQPVTGTFLIDTGTQEYRKFNRGFYVIEAILLDKGNVSIKSKVTSWSSDQHRFVELRSIEIQRREYVLLSKFNGTRSYIFRRKTYGQRCPECWDNRLEKIMKDHCSTCIGTGFKGGYFDGAPCFINYDTNPNSNLKTYFGVFEPSQITGWTISLPEIRPDDIVVQTGTWDVYRVEGMTPTVLQTNTVRQVLKLTQLSKNDIENQLVTKNLPDFPIQYL